KKLILIDGNAILHRAFHALPPLTNKDGIIVNAVYGFFSMFLKILEDQKPDFIIVCFDKKAPTFRKELFVGYQAKRPKMSDDLVPQIEFVHEILNKAKVEIFEVDGYEADDLIGTIANQSQKSSIRQAQDKSQNGGIDVYIVSGDRDLLQLVNHHVKMIAPITGLTNMIIFDEASVFQKYGIRPSQMVGYKALVGDPSDNYPGVTGVGPKTASILINEYKSLENIYKNLEKIKNKNPNLALKLAEGAEAAGLAQKLAGIVLDAPITLDIKKAKIEYLDKEGMKQEFEKYGFNSLLKRMLPSIPVVVKNNPGIQSSIFD
ncbi:MAG: 5'-3' exonuclease H3TH domain-containing protein, partial [Candidatus Levybacteria bacterium]|nr:5'-3' exonuclease H3TH domain-containing protein [Candidatus Levybacteria bacterium]